MPSLAEIQGIKRSWETPVIDKVKVNADELVYSPSGSVIKALSLISNKDTLSLGNAITEAFGCKVQHSPFLFETIVSLLNDHNSIDPQYAIPLVVVDGQVKGRKHLYYHIAKEDFETSVEFLSANYEHLKPLLPFRITSEEHKLFLAGNVEMKAEITERLYILGVVTIGYHSKRNYSEEELHRILDPLINHPNFCALLRKPAPIIGPNSEAINHLRKSIRRKMGKLKIREEKATIPKATNCLNGGLREFFAERGFSSYPAERLLGTLPPELRSAFIYRYEENLSDPEIGFKTSTSAKKARLRYHIARQHLQAVLNKPQDQWPPFNSNCFVHLMLDEYYWEDFKGGVKCWKPEEKKYLNLRFRKLISNKQICSQMGINLSEGRILADRIRNFFIKRALELQIVAQDDVVSKYIESA